MVQHTEEQAWGATKRAVFFAAVCILWAVVVGMGGWLSRNGNDQKVERIEACQGFEDSSVAEACLDEVRNEDPPA